MMDLENIDENEIQDDAFENIAEIEEQQGIFRNINADVFYWKDDACEVIERRALREILERLMGRIKKS